MTGLRLDGGAVGGGGGGGLTPEQEATLASWGTPAAPTSAYPTMSARSGAAYAPALDRLMYAAIVLCPGHTYTAFGARCSGAAAAGGVLRIGIYENVNGVPGDLITDGGPVASDSIGNKWAAINYTATIPVVFVGVAPQVDVTGLTILSGSHNSQWNAGNLFAAATGESVGVRYEAGVSGALPATATPVASYGGGNAINFLAMAY